MNMQNRTRPDFVGHNAPIVLVNPPMQAQAQCRLSFAIFSELKRSAALLLASVVWITVGAWGVHAKGRIALLLGAEKYQNFKASQISAAQTAALGQALIRRGFSVTVVSDPGNATARAALTDFSRKAVGSDFALIVATGHFATYRRQSFFLPTNVRVRRSTDLFSRGLSVASFADIAARAKAGAVAMIVTVPDIPSTVAGVSARPDLAAELPAHVTIAFSTSSKIPVSSVDKVSARAMADLAEWASGSPMMLSTLLDSASAGGTGLVFGKLKDIDLSTDVAEEPAKPPLSETVATLEKEAERELEEARRAQELAEARKRAEALVSEAERRAREAEQRAREVEARARRELAAAKAAQEAQAAEAARANQAAEAARANAAAQAAKAAQEVQAAQVAEVTKTEPAVTSNPPATAQPQAADESSLQSLQVVEALLGRQQRQTIQRLLRTKGLYDGPIDGIFGKRTRLAIRAFQKAAGAPETGYMTPEQFQQLVSSR